MNTQNDLRVKNKQANDRQDKCNGEMRLLTLFAAAKMLNIAVNTIKALIHQGKIQTVSIGKRNRIPLASLRSFVAGKEANNG